jgi:hypothetical protein
MATTRLAAGAASVNNALSENPTSFNTWGALLLGFQGEASNINFYQPLDIDSNNNLFIGAETTSKGFLGKMSPSGVFVKQVRSDASGTFSAVGVDSSGNVYIAKELTNSSDGTAIIKYDNNLNQIWQVVYKYNTSGWSCYKIKFDSSGQPHFCVYNGSGHFVAFKINSTNGALTSAWKFTASTSYNNSMEVDSSGNVYLGGQSSAWGFYGAGLFKTSSTTAVAWTRHVQGTGSYPSGYVYDIRVDSSGDVYILGGVDATATIQKAFLIKLNSSGNQIWKRTMYFSSGTNRYAQGYKMDIDSSGNIYCTGRIYGTGTLTQCFLMKFNSSGTLQYQRSIAGPTGFTLESSFLKLDTTGNSLYMSFSMYLGSLQSSGILKIPSDGSKTGAITVNGINICNIASSSYTVDDSTDVTVTTPSSPTSNTTATPTSTARLGIYPFPGSLVSVASI